MVALLFPAPCRLLLRLSLGPLVLLFLAESSLSEDFVYVPPACAAGEAGDRGEAALLRCYAPVFVVEKGARSYNRIGTPEIRLSGAREKVRVNPDVPAAFTEVRRDRIGETGLLQLLYRVHFTRLPFKPSVFFEMHRNFRPRPSPRLGPRRKSASLAKRCRRSSDIPSRDVRGSRCDLRRGPIGFTRSRPWRSRHWAPAWIFLCASWKNSAACPSPEAREPSPHSSTPMGS